MKKKNIILIIAIVVIYSLVFKSWNLLIYTDSKSLVDFITEIMKTYESPEIVTIETQDVKNYVEFENIKFKDIFQKYEKIESSSNSLQYIVYNEKENSLDKYFSIKQTSSYGASFVYGFKNYSEQNSDNEYEEITLYDPEETSEYLQENNVTSDPELFNFLLENYNNENKLLMKNSTMKENHYIKEFIANNLPRIKKLYVFKGINGYMFEMNGGSFEIYVDNYEMTIMGMEKEEIIELVRTIKLNEEKAE